MGNGIAVGLVLIIGGLLLFLRLYFGVKKGHFPDKYGGVSKVKNPLGYKMEYYTGVFLIIIFFGGAILSFLFL